MPFILTNKLVILHVILNFLPRVADYDSNYLTKSLVKTNL